MNEIFPYTTQETRRVAKEVDISDLLRKMITGTQIRIARAALGWTVAELARRSGVSASSIQRAETGGGVPTMQSANLFRVQRALELGDERGAVTFIDADESGGEAVRLRRR